jgi:membrane protein required for colicin V production
MNLFDLISIGLIAYGSFRGFSKGLIVEMSSLLAIFLGFTTGINFDDLISNFLYTTFNIEFSLLKIFVFLIIFFITYSLVILVAKSITKFIKVVNLGLLNSLFGGIFGLTKWSLLFIVLVWIIHSIEFSNFEATANSFMYGLLLDLSEILFNIIETEDEVFLQKFT